MPNSPQHNFPTAHAANKSIEVLYADASLLVLNKPTGLLAVPGRGEDKQDCLSARVQAHYPDALIVHRLDMATSGLMLMARGIDMQRTLGKAFESREVHKRYVAVVNGCLQLPTDAIDGWATIDLPIIVDWPNRPLRIIDPARGQPSLTRWQVLPEGAQAGTTRLLLEPVTGRSHQLRVHLQALGHPILGDALYADTAVQARADRLLLHASALRLPHPVTGEPMQFERALPF
ncbi:RluA family pseudouridine synthase [Polaromonas sp. P1(28)-13]|nr:RluA family pseudouridine synthase [Polaromonas sp. P1(28)-13]